MSTLILDGRIAREARMPELVARVKDLVRPPQLAIIQVGDRADTASYIRAKTAFAAKIGAKVKHIHLPESATEKEIIEKIAVLKKYKFCICFENTTHLNGYITEKIQNCFAELNQT